MKIGDDSKSKSVTITVAALNEALVIEDVLREIYHTCASFLDEFEIIAINDGSADATGINMESFASSRANVRVLHNNNSEGLGSSFKKGLSLSQYPYYMLLCGDGGFPASSLPAVFDKMGLADIIVPYMTNLQSIKTPARYFISNSYTFLLNKIFFLDLKYYNGLPLYRTDQLDSIEIISEGFAFQGEILIKLIKTGATYLQVPVLGAEKTNRSSALSIKNFIGVATTFAHLIREIKIFIVRNNP